MKKKPFTKFDKVIIVGSEALVRMMFAVLLLAIIVSWFGLGFAYAADVFSKVDVLLARHIDQPVGFFIKLIPLIYIELVTVVGLITQSSLVVAGDEW